MARAITPHTPLSRDEIKYLEHTLATLPTAKTEAADGEAEGLLKYGYHQNPYLRAFAKLLWSGYALARGQIADGSQRFAQARRDATVSAVDANTARVLEEAAGALERAMAPDGSISGFLGELRGKTMPRLWSRVCETMNLPPPRFAVIFGTQPTRSAEEAEAAEMAEMAALCRVQPAPDLFEEDADDDEGQAPTQGRPAMEAATDYGDDNRPEPREREDRPRHGERTPSGPLGINVGRHGGADLAGELLLSACSEVLKELRLKRPHGSVEIRITVEGQSGGGQPRGEGGNGDRRRRRHRDGERGGNRRDSGDRD
jgi:hypothetical protein